MITALDTNILLRQVNPTDPLRPAVLQTLKNLHDLGHVFRLVPQNLYEFWVVGTRPILNNGLGMSVLECDEKPTAIEALFPFSPDEPNLAAPG